jgi:hypothetical protein
VSLLEDLAHATPHGVLYLRRLVRSQLTLSLLALIAFGGLIGGLPLGVYLLPGLQRVHVLGIPITIVATLWPPFPLLVGIGWLYSRRAAALEDAFRDLLQ